MLTPTTTRHGTNTAYRDGCRCYACAAAHSAAGAAYKQRVAQGIRLHHPRSIATDPKHPHGTLSCYTNDRCGCEPCRTAWRDYHAERKARLAQTGTITVDAAPVRAAIIRAGLSGYGCASVARRAGVSVSAVKIIRRGDTALTRLSNATAILDACAELCRHPATGASAQNARRRAWAVAS